MRLVGRLITILFIAVGFALPEKEAKSIPAEMRDAEWFAEHSTELAIVPHERQTPAMVRNAVLANCTMSWHASPAILAGLMKEPAVRKAVDGCTPEPKTRKTDTVRAAVTEFVLQRK